MLSHCIDAAATLLHNTVTYFCYYITFNFTSSCVLILISWAEVMFLRNNILTNKSVNTLLTACVLNNLITEVF